MRLAPVLLTLAAFVLAFGICGPPAFGLTAPAVAAGAAADGSSGDTEPDDGDEDTSPDEPGDGGDDSDDDADSGDGDDSNLYPCPETTWTLCLQSGRFQVEVDWFTTNDDDATQPDDGGDASNPDDGNDDGVSNPNDGDDDGVSNPDDGDDDDSISNPNDGDDDGSSGMGQLVYPSSDSAGLFYFFDPDNWEMLVKVLDGCAHNGHYWVFGAAATDVGYEISVYDMSTGSPPAVKVYDKPAGPPAPALVDVAAFPCEAGVPE